MRCSRIQVLAAVVKRRWLLIGTKQKPEFLPARLEKAAAQRLERSILSARPKWVSTGFGVF